MVLNAIGPLSQPVATRCVADADPDDVAGPAIDATAAVIRPIPMDLAVGRIELAANHRGKLIVSSPAHLGRYSARVPRPS